MIMIAIAATNQINSGLSGQWNDMPHSTWCVSIIYIYITFKASAPYLIILGLLFHPFATYSLCRLNRVNNINFIISDLASMNPQFKSYANDDLLMTNQYLAINHIQRFNIYYLSRPAVTSLSYQHILSLKAYKYKFVALNKAESLSPTSIFGNIFKL